MTAPKYRTAPVVSENLPKGIPYIIGNEAAERFSFYGMKAILTVFMTKHLLDVYGVEAPMSDELTKEWVHNFTAAVYFFPIFGAILSDWLLGKYRTILALSMVYCAGHAVLATDIRRTCDDGYRTTHHPFTESATTQHRC